MSAGEEAFRVASGRRNGIDQLPMLMAGGVGTILDFRTWYTRRPATTIPAKSTNQIQPPECRRDEDGRALRLSLALRPDSGRPESGGSGSGTDGSSQFQPPRLFGLFDFIPSTSLLVKGTYPKHGSNPEKLSAQTLDSIDVRVLFRRLKGAAWTGLGDLLSVFQHSPSILATMSPNVSGGIFVLHRDPD